MSRQADEKQARKTAKSTPTAAPPDFWSFHPTEADRRRMAEMDSSPLALFNMLEEEVSRGIVFTLTRSKTGDSMCLIARNRFDSYGQGQALSVFHVDVERLLLGMLYVLRVKQPDWPSVPATSAQAQIDW